MQNAIFAEQSNAKVTDKSLKVCQFYVGWIYLLCFASFIILKDYIAVRELQSSSHLKFEGNLRKL